jgi:tRNA-dihydrouridine synthase B
MFENFPIIAAPMAGITDAPFRNAIRSSAPDAYLMTEMISCHSIAALRKNSNRNFDRYDDRTGAQIFGAEPKLMAEAAKILEQSGAGWIDINMGCPVPKVATRAGAGANLMRDQKLAGQIVAEVVKAVKIPVSIKTRLGWDASTMNSAELVRIAADVGAAFATVHGRTRAQGYSGNADWRAIARIKNEELRIKNFPIMFNGDIKTAEDISAVKALGADGAMIGRAMLGQPWIIGELSSRQSIVGSRQSIILKHFDETVEYYGEKAGVPMFRKHAAWYVAGMPNSSAFKTAINGMRGASEMRAAIGQFFGCNV